MWRTPHSAMTSTILDRKPILSTGDLLEVPPGGGTDGRAAASGEVMRVWTGSNPEEASAWRNRQPLGPVRDEAISSFLEWAGANDPEAAFMWAGHVSDLQTRTEAIDEIIRHLGEKAPEAVAAWLASDQSLPAEERERAQQRAGAEGRQ